MTNIKTFFSLQRIVVQLKYSIDVKSFKSEYMSFYFSIKKRMH